MFLYEQPKSDSPIPFLILSPQINADFLARFNRIQDPAKKIFLENSFKRIKTEYQIIMADTPPQDIQIQFAKIRELQAECFNLMKPFK